MSHRPILIEAQAAVERLANDTSVNPGQRRQELERLRQYATTKIEELPEDKPLPPKKQPKKGPQDVPDSDESIHGKE